jgi:hypothetical protein
MSKTPKIKQDVFDTLKQAAAHFDLELAQIKWCKAAGAPGFVHSRVHSVKFGAWLKANRDSIPEPGDLGNAKDKIDRLRARKLELEIAELEGDSISRDELDAALTAAAANMQAVLHQKIIEELPANCAGMPAEEISKFCEAAFSAVIAKWKEFALKWEYSKQSTEP